jgi:protein phosphatase
MSGTTLRSAARTDVGRSRDRNEDSYFAGDNVFAVADGLGGHNAGDVASKIAIEPVKALDRHFAKVDPATVADALNRTVLEANRAVFKKAQDDAKVRGMGTTLTVLAVADGAAHLAHVGDSRCYLLRGEALSQLSTDHTLVARMVQEGKLTIEQAETHPQRSILTRALGAESEVDVDALEIELQQGDRLLLCSDGLSSVIPEEKIFQILNEAKGLDEACRALIDEANSVGGPDNITVVLVEVTEAERRRAVMATSSAPSKPDAPVADRDGPPPRGKRRVPVRGIIWVLALVVILLGGWLGVRTWIDNSYYVGVERGTVTIYRGVPTEIAGMKLHRVQEKTNIPTARVSEIWRRRLDEGIRTANLAKARAVVANILEENPAPSSTPSPTPTKT